VKITSELMEKVLRYDAANAAKYLNDLQNIIDEIKKLEKELIEEKLAYENRVKEIHREIADKRKSCDHPVRKYQGDPSGGSDSVTWCEICGMEL
jgi:cell shape-determining protein MreC